MIRGILDKEILHLGPVRTFRFLPREENSSTGTNSHITIQISVLKYPLQTLYEDL